MGKIPAEDKSLEVVAGGYHELLLGPQKEACFNSIGKWVLDRSAARTGKSAL